MGVANRSCLHLKYSEVAGAVGCSALLKPHSAADRQQGELEEREALLVARFSQLRLSQAGTDWQFRAREFVPVEPPICFFPLEER